MRIYYCILWLVIWGYHLGIIRDHILNDLFTSLWWTIYNCLYIWQSYSVWPQKRLNFGIWFVNSLYFFETWSPILVVVILSTPCCLVLCRKNDHQITVEYPLLKSQCLLINLSLLLCFLTVLLPCIYIAPPHPPTPLNTTRGNSVPN